VDGVGTENILKDNLPDEQIKDWPGPIYPRVLGETISRNTINPVHWRQSGIVGEGAKDVDDHCMGVIQDVVDNRRPPDMVLIVCGISDLRRFATNPLKNAGPKEFRNRMTSLISHIREILPKARSCCHLSRHKCLDVTLR
jgi:lysophospholipase L1-like esterase